MTLSFYNKNNTAVVIPAYCEEATIGPLVAAARRYVARVIVVDDGSRDGTAAVASAHGAALIRHGHNCGKAAALTTGCRYALALGAAAVITLDGDGQHDPGDIPAFLAAANCYPDRIVLGARRSCDRGRPRHRYIANRIADFWVSWAAGRCIVDSQCGFRLYPRALLCEFERKAARSRGFAYESEVLIEAVRAGLGVASMPVAALYPRYIRPSHFRPGADILCIMAMVSRKLIGRGLYLPGLYNSLRWRK
jgi:glycosyltransferase involved in cell wall biosynthesis